MNDLKEKPTNELVAIRIELETNKKISAELSSIPNIDVQRMKRDFLLYLQALKPEKQAPIYACTKASIAMALLSCAKMGLYPTDKNIYLIPIEGQCKAQASYLGLQQIVLRDPSVKKIVSRLVHEKDEFRAEYDNERGDDDKIIHVPSFHSENKEIIGVYAIIFFVDGSRRWEFFNKAQIEQAKKSSPYPAGAWTSWPGEMARKSVIKRLLKHTNIYNESLRELITLDDEDYKVIDGQADEMSSENDLIKACEENSI